MGEAYHFGPCPSSKVVKGKVLAPAPKLCFNPFHDDVASPELLLDTISVTCVLTDPNHCGPFAELYDKLSGDQATVAWDKTSQSFTATFASLAVNVDGYTKFIEDEWVLTDTLCTRYLVFCCSVETSDGHREQVYQREFAVDIVCTESELGM